MRNSRRRDVNFDPNATWRTGTSKHSVQFTVPKRPLERAEVEFTVPQDGKQLGELKASKGSLAWFHGKTHVNGENVTWSEFDELMAHHASKREFR